MSAEASDDTSKAAKSELGDVAVAVEASADDAVVIKEETAFPPTPDPVADAAAAAAAVEAVSPPASVVAPAGGGAGASTTAEGGEAASSEAKSASASASPPEAASADAPNASAPPAAAKAGGGGPAQPPWSQPQQQVPIQPAGGQPPLGGGPYYHYPYYPPPYPQQHAQLPPPNAGAGAQQPQPQPQPQPPLTQAQEQQPQQSVPPPGVIPVAHAPAAPAGGGGLLVANYNDASQAVDPIPDTRRNRGGVTEPFPDKLHRMIDYAERHGMADVISFFSHGRAFAIHKPRRFVTDIMPRFFRQTRITSFQRQLNLYGFQRISQGPDNGGYYHELFLKGRPGLSVNMKRTKVKGATKAKRDPDLEPNFYAMRPVTAAAPNGGTGPPAGHGHHPPHFDAPALWEPADRPARRVEPPGDRRAGGGCRRGGIGAGLVAGAATAYDDDGGAAAAAAPRRSPTRRQSSPPYAAVPLLRVSLRPLPISPRRGAAVPAPRHGGTVHGRAEPRSAHRTDGQRARRSRRLLYERRANRRLDSIGSDPDAATAAADDADAAIPGVSALPVPVLPPARSRRLGLLACDGRSATARGASRFDETRKGIDGDR